MNIVFIILIHSSSSSSSSSSNLHLPQSRLSKRSLLFWHQGVL
jgi:hypothetical protein